MIFRLPAIGLSYRNTSLLPARYRTPTPVRRGRVEPLHGIVGATGAAQSTLVRLILRFTDPRSGRVCIDGNDLRGLSYASLRGAIGYDTVVGERGRSCPVGNASAPYPRVTQGRTAIVIAHRLSPVRHADRIWANTSTPLRRALMITRAEG
ncbi:MAG: ATP-binding cassette domain-containing protein [Pseudonocardiaceae bacterium]